MCPHFSFVRTRHQRRAAAAYRNGDLFVFIGESITSPLFFFACSETNDLLISLITSLWTAEMDGLNKEVDTQTGCLCPYVGVLHHRAAVQNVNAEFLSGCPTNGTLVEFGEGGEASFELNVLDLLCLFWTHHREALIIAVCHQSLNT